MKTLRGLFIFVVFLLIISLLLIVTNNTIHTNKVIEEQINSLVYQSEDTTLTKDSFINFKEGVLKTKIYILDSNTISYLFQVLTILIIGIGFYLLNSFQEKIESANKQKSDFIRYINNNNFSIELIGITNHISALSTTLNESDPISSNNIESAFVIEDQLLALIKLTTLCQNCSLKLNKKKYILDTLNIALRKSEILKEKTSFFQEIYNYLNQIINIIAKIKAENRMLEDYLK